MRFPRRFESPFVPELQVVNAEDLEEFHLHHHVPGSIHLRLPISLEDVSSHYLFGTTLYFDERNKNCNWAAYREDGWMEKFFPFNPNEFLVGSFPPERIITTKYINIARYNLVLSTESLRSLVRQLNCSQVDLSSFSPARIREAFSD